MFRSCVLKSYKRSKESVAVLKRV